MAIVEATQEVPLTTTVDGTLRIGDSRVSLDSVIHHYRRGATAEEIVLRFPGLRLADVHATIAYFLNHSDEIDEYLSQRQQDGTELRKLISSDPVQQKSIGELRDRIQARL